jgi:hypothetical protein
MKECQDNIKANLKERCRGDWFRIPMRQLVYLRGIYIFTEMPK